MAEAQVQIDVNAQDNASRELDRLSGKTRRFGSQMRDTARRATQAATRIATGVGAIGTALGTVAGRQFVDFQSAMKEVQAISGATDEQFDKLKETAKELGSETRFSATEAASGMKFLSRAGFEVQESIDALPSVLQAATATSTQLGQAADITTNIMSAFGKEASDTGEVADQLVKATNSANTSLSELGRATSEVGAIAQSAGMTLSETTAIIGKMSDAGIKGEKAGTALKGAIARLQDPSKDAKEALDELGLSVEDIQEGDGSLKTMNEILKLLEENEATAAETTKIFGQEAGPKLQAVLQQGTDGLEDLREEIKDSEGAASDAADTMREGFQGAVKELQGVLQTFAVTAFEETLADKLTPVVEESTKKIKNFKDAISSTEEEAKSLPPAMDRTANSIKEAGNQSKNTGESFSFLNDFLGLSDQNLKTLKQTWKFFVPVLKLARDVIVDSFVIAFRLLNNTIRAVRDTVLSFIDTFGAVLSAMQGDMEEAKEQLTSAWDNIKSAGVNALKALRDAAFVFLGKFLKPFRVLPNRVGRELARLPGVMLKPFRGGVNRVNGLLGRFNPSGIISGTVQKFTGFLQNRVPNAIRAPFNEGVRRVNRLLGRFNPVILIRNAANSMFNWLRRHVPNFIKEPFRDAIDDANGLLSAFSPARILSGIGGSIKGVMDAVPGFIRNPVKSGIDAANRLLSNFSPAAVLEDAFNGIPNLNFNLNTSGNSDSGSGSGFFSFLPGRAEGGPVQAGRSFLVGERGPEVFTPSTNGNVMSNEDSRQALSGGQQINVENITINAPSGDGEEIARNIKRVLSDDQELVEQGINLPS